MAKEKLNRFHIALLLFNTQNGVGIFTLPRITATYFGTNGWVSLLFVAFVAGINIMIISAVYRLGKGQSILDILGTMPKLLTYPIYLVIGGNLAFIACLVVKQYAMIYQIMVFPSTSDMKLKFILDIIVLMYVFTGIYTMSKANVIFTFLLITQLPLALAFLGEFDFARLTPFLFQERGNMVTGFFKIYSAFMGYELALFLFPYAENDRRWLKYVHVGNLITMSVYLLICVICFGFFHYQGLPKQAFPLLDLFAYLRFPFVERIQNFLYSLFLLSIVHTSAMYYWSSQTVFSWMIPRFPWKWIVFIVVLGTYFIMYIPKKMEVIDQWFKFATYLQFGIAFSLPLLLILILLMKRRKVSHV